MPLFILKTRRGGRPKTFDDLEILLAAIRVALDRSHGYIGGQKLIVEVKPEGDAK